MFEDHNDTIYEVIKNAGLLDPAQLDELNESHLHTGKSLADAVIDSGVVERGQILSAVADFLGYEYLEKPPTKVDDAIASTVRASVARMYAVHKRLECPRRQLSTLQPTRLGSWSARSIGGAAARLASGFYRLRRRHCLGGRLWENFVLHVRAMRRFAAAPHTPGLR
jgi:hypothetical protein